MHWPELREPLGFDRDRAPRATTISRALAGAPFAQLQEALLDWMMGMGVVSDRELSGAVDGKRPQQSQDAAGQPRAMVNVLAHELKVCLAQWPGPPGRKGLWSQIGGTEPQARAVAQKGAKLR